MTLIKARILPFCFEIYHYFLHYEQNLIILKITINLKKVKFWP